MSEEKNNDDFMQKLADALIKAGIPINNNVSNNINNNPINIDFGIINEPNKFNVKCNTEYINSNNSSAYCNIISHLFYGYNKIKHSYFIEQTDLQLKIDLDTYDIIMVFDMTRESTKYYQIHTLTIDYNSILNEYKKWKLNNEL